MSAAGSARTPAPPYYAVIFSSTRTAIDEGYGAMADRMLELARQQAGFLDMESVRDADGFGITVSYWSSLESIATWKAHGEHRIAPSPAITRRSWPSTRCASRAWNARTPGRRTNRRRHSPTLGVTPGMGDVERLSRAVARS